MAFPVELLEMLLMKSFRVIFVHHLRTDGHVSDAERLAYTTLSSVCSDWWQTLNGWPQSDTKYWVKHRLQGLVRFVCRPYRRRPLLFKQLDPGATGVAGVTQMNDKIYVAGLMSDTIKVFGPNYEELDDIVMMCLVQPGDIVACRDSGSLYVADCGWPDCVWRLSAGGPIDRFTAAATRLNPRSVSLTSRRLLVTTRDDGLVWYGSYGVELKRLSVADVDDIQHAVETSRGTFVLCHLRPQPQVVEVDGDGRIVSMFDGRQQLAGPRYMSFDSMGKILVADVSRRHVLLLSGDLQLDRVLLSVDENRLSESPHRLLYVEQARQLVVVSAGLVHVFTVG